MERYIGLDVHSTSTTMSVVSERGKQLKSVVLETNGQALVEAVRMIAGRRHLCLEEGTHSAWLFEVLSPHVDQLVVTHVSESRGPKDDALDAFKIANALRVGTAEPVFKDRGRFSRLRTLSDVYMMVTTDLVRVQNRLKALYRSRGVRTSGQSVYSKRNRDEWLGQLPITYRSSAELLYAQLDALREVKKDAHAELVEESHRHSISRVLETCPGLGSVRVALLLPILVTPHRFRTSRQLWAYSGLGVVMRSSSDWVPADSGWVRAQVNRTRGLNRNFNRRLKHIFKGAATAVLSHRIEPLYGDYVRLTEQGTKPPLAKLTLARRIASTTLAMWKNQEEYDPGRHRTQS